MWAFYSSLFFLLLLNSGIFNTLANASKVGAEFCDSRWDTAAIQQEITDWSCDLDEIESPIFYKRDFRNIYFELMRDLQTEASARDDTDKPSSICSVLGAHPIRVIPICHQEDGRLISVVSVKKNLGRDNTWVRWILSSPKEGRIGGGRAGILAAYKYSLMHSGNGTLKLESTGTAEGFYARLGFKRIPGMISDTYQLDCTHCQAKL